MNKIGYDGFQGRSGLQGPHGIKGITGPIGFQGIAGNVGYPGINGIKGVKGKVGLQGFDGPKGFAGINGADGPIGEQGDKGDDGPIGNAGIIKQGPVGKNGYDAFLTTYTKGQIDDVFNITKNKNLPVVDNAIVPDNNPLLTKVLMPLAPPVNGFIIDAYCPANNYFNDSGVVVNGFQGVTNFPGQNRLFSLTCSPVNLIYNSRFFEQEEYYVYNPETFYQGNLGADGVQGFRGVKGYQGVPGTQGPVGNHGPVGPNGFPGNVGDDGPIGERGPVGDRGIPGINGEVGPRGIKGPKGVIGEIGNRGKSYVGKQGKFGYPGKVTVDFLGCVSTIPSSSPTFDCPNNTWLSGMHIDQNNNYRGACCPYVVYDDDTYDTQLNVKYADKNGKPYPPPQKYLTTQVRDVSRYRNLNVYSPELRNQYVVPYGKRLYDLQGLFQNDVKAYYNSTL